MQTKKSMRILLILCLVAVLAVSAYAAEYETTDTSGDWTYTLSGGEATVTAYTGHAKNVTVPNTLGDCPVVAIDSYAFDENIVLTTITFPDTLTSIGEYAFMGCENLKEVTLPEGLTWLGGSAFYGCSALGKVTVLSSDLSCSGSGAFPQAGSDTENGMEVIFADSVKVIPSCMFCSNSTYGYANVTSVNIGKNVETIEYRAFAGCQNLKTVTIDPDAALTEIGFNAFNSCTSLAQITLPENLTSVGVHAFTNCYALEEVTVYASALSDFHENGTFEFAGKTAENGMEVIFTDSVTVIPAFMFSTDDSRNSSHARVSSVSIGQNVRSIGDSVFAYCSELKAVVFDENAKLEAIGQDAFYRCEALSDITLPDSLAEIGDFAFYSCKTLSDITLPDALTKIGELAFCGCKGLKSITLPADVAECGDRAFASTGLTEILVDSESATFCSVNGVLFSKDMANLIYYPTARADHSYTVPDGVNTICEFSFSSCRGLTSVVISDGVTSVGELAFDGCSNLEAVQIPASVTSIGLGSFSADENDCKNLSDVYYTGSEEQWESILIEDNNDALYLADIHYNAKMPISNPFTDVPEGAWYCAPVLWALENGITTGSSATTFNPEGQCQRAQVVTFLWRAAGQPEPASTANPFADVKETDFYYKAVLWAVEKGITNGTDETHFSPDQSCNRAQVVTFLWRAMEQPASDAQTGFTDVVEGEFYDTAVAWAVEKGITNGMGDGTFGVNTVCNRAQVVTFLYRTYVN